MLSWIKFVCFAFSRLKVVSTFLVCGLANLASTAQLLPDRYLRWHHCQPYLIYFPVVPSKFVSADPRDSSRFRYDL